MRPRANAISWGAWWAVFALVTLGAGGCATGSEEQPPRSEAPASTLREREAPRGATVETVARGLEVPWEMAFLPDGRALVTERPGRVRMLSAQNRLEPEPVAEVDVVDSSAGEGGLLGLAVDPGFDRNGFVYLYRTVESGNEVVRYRLEGEALREDGVVFDGLVAGVNHNGGRMRFGPDGYLYVTTGEAYQQDLAQDPGSLNGKILRTREFRRDGVRPEIFTTGHRNVQGLDWEPRTDRLVATEFGPDSDDEVNVLRRGRNYGWPERTGAEGAPRFEPALVNYEDVVAPSGASFVSRKGSAWSGDYLVACLVGEQLRRLSFGDGGRPRADEILLEGRLGRLRSVVEGPDGAIYVLTSNRDGRGSPTDEDDRVVRIRPPRA